MAGGSGAALKYGRPDLALQPRLLAQGLRVQRLLGTQKAPPEDLAHREMEDVSEQRPHRSWGPHGSLKHPDEWSPVWRGTQRRPVQCLA